MPGLDPASLLRPAHAGAGRAATCGRRTSCAPAARPPRLALVMPGASELETVVAVHQRMVGLVDSGLDALVWIAVIDSACPENVRAWLRDMAARDDRIHVIDLGPPHGPAHAYLAGYAHARRLGAERIIEIDAGPDHASHRVSARPAAPAERPLDDAAWWDLDDSWGVDSRLWVLLDALRGIAHRIAARLRRRTPDAVRMAPQGTAPLAVERPVALSGTRRDEGSAESEPFRKAS
jgi:hypothetical protein